MKIVDGRKVLITREELYKINRIVGYGGWVRYNIKQLLEKEGNAFIVSTSLICDFSDALSGRVKQCKQYLEDIIDINEYMGNQLSRLLDSFSSETHLLVNEYSYETGRPNLVVNNEMIDQVYEIFLLEKNLYKLKDYSCAKEDIRKNLSCFCPEDIIREIENEYNEKLAILDIDGLSKVLERSQQLIINHWKEYVTDIHNYDPGKPYNFLCHSTNAIDFKGDFHSKYVSCSLLSEELTDTYRNGYGFILSPDTIVLASSSDMFVRNDVMEEEDLIYFSSIKKIASPERIKEEAIDKKMENRKNKRQEKVYTEVVVDGFHPIAIFYLDDGIKEFDYNYDRALNLKEQFPELEIIPLDITQHKTKEESYEIRKNVIDKIRRVVGKSDYIVRSKDGYIKNFDLFWNRYLRLIKTKNYTINDVNKLFDENVSLIQPSNLIFNHLFDGTYDSEEIEQILYYNYQTRIIDILENNVSVGQLDSLFHTLKVYKDNPKLEEFVPGISLFIKLYPYVHLGKSTNVALKKCNSIDSLNSYLSYLIYEKGEHTINFEVDTLKEEYLQGKVTYQSIYKLYEGLQEIQNKNGLDTVSSDVFLFMRLYPVTKIDSILLEKLGKVDSNDLTSINELLLESLSRKKESVEDKVDRYERKLSLLEEEKVRTEEACLNYNESVERCNYEVLYNIAKKDIYDVSNEIKKLQSSIMQSEVHMAFLQRELSDSQVKMNQFQKHKLFHFFKIKKGKKQNEDKETSIANLKSIMYVDELHLEQFQSELRDLKEKFESQTTFSFDEYGEKLEWAKEFINTFDEFHARNRINNLDQIINRLKSMLENYKKEIVEYGNLESWYKK